MPPCLAFSWTRHFPIFHPSSRTCRLRGAHWVCNSLWLMLEPIAISNRPSQLSPDVETYRAVVPGTATLSDSLVIGISSPYRKTGLLHQKFKAHYGRDGDVLVIRAPSLLLNPTLDPRII
jgi:hypothetical protein